MKKAKAELEEIRLRQQELVEALIGDYRVVLKDIDDGGPAQLALAKATEMTEIFADRTPGKGEAAREAGGADFPCVVEAAGLSG
ncbi:hypothetical protein BOQ63_003465 (plasmid) [Streptomyces viridifaciens]|nr:hypothetical protein BOQ63_003465 [Streptomyces viridifaciens]